MKIKKLGHCCLLIQTKGKTILTDPGVYSDSQNSLTGIDVVLITHEHPDHLHTDSVKQIVANNPGVRIFTNSSVGKKLDEIGVAYSVLEGNATELVEGILLEAFDAQHEEIFEDFALVQNTGYMIDDKLFYPGDAFHNPNKTVDVLALPVAGPWCSINRATHYAIDIKPRVAFPVHDALLDPTRIGGHHKVPEIFLPKNGIEFVPMLPGDEREF